jgi:hypothetical protein
MAVGRRAEPNPAVTRHLCLRRLRVAVRKPVRNSLVGIACSRCPSQTVALRRVPRSLLLL